MWNDVPDYGAQLRAAVADYTGKRQNVIRRAPDIYDFFGRLMMARTLHPHEKQIVSAVLGYFVVLGDVVPEEDLGPIGLIDNLFVAAHGYRTLQTSLSAATIQEAWNGTEDIDSVMRDVYTESRAELGKRRKDVLRLAGLAS